MLTGRITITAKGGPLDKNTLFALASALTLTAKQAQTDTIQAIEGAFTIRSAWAQPSRVTGVRVKPATKTNLVALVGTAADWLEKFVKKPAGATVIKLPQGEFLAVPTSNVRRTKRDIIRATQRPRALRGKREFVIKLPGNRGALLLQRQGRGKQKKNVVLYVLTPRARVQTRDVLFGPAQRAFERHFSRIYGAQLEKAFKTARR